MSSFSLRAFFGYGESLSFVLFMETVFMVWPPEVYDVMTSPKVAFSYSSIKLPEIADAGSYCVLTTPLFI